MITDKKFKPNAKLPEGGRAIKPRKKSVGGWVEMWIDAEVLMFGIRFFRIQGGMSGTAHEGPGDNSSETWVADVPLICISVHEYDWNPDSFWPEKNRGSFRAACAAALKSGISTVGFRKAEAKKKLKDYEEAERVLTHAISFIK